ncbi:MAG: hypothetical protein AAGJ56_04080 [Myxococcota bacterium]
MRFPGLVPGLGATDRRPEVTEVADKTHRFEQAAADTEQSGVERVTNTGAAPLVRAAPKVPVCNRIASFSKHNGPPVDFPLTAAGQHSLSESNAVSPTLKTERQVVVPDFADIVELPTHVGDKGFWPEFEPIVDLQLARRQGGAASEHFKTPKIFDGFSTEQAAQAVRADFPTKFPTDLVEQFLAEGVRPDPKIIPQRSAAEFTRGPVGYGAIIGEMILNASPSCFAAKWSEGRARPEEVAWLIHTGQISAPCSIREKVAQLGLKRPEDFTAYEEGCPRHPAWPAMHSAASCASTYLAVVMDLSPQQIAEARRVDWAVATSRSLAGVHYATDNSAGLMIGQEAVRRTLPEYLQRKFGADPDAVRQKLDTVFYDWTKHDPFA